MLKKIRTAFAVAGMLGCLTVGSALAQTDQTDQKMSSSNSKMSHQGMMDKMAKMSPDDKAAMFDHMTEKDKMAAMKMGGHDMGKMSHEDMMDKMGKMSTQDKSDAFDKMPSQKKMAMMKDMDKMNHDKMDKQ